MLWPHHQGLPLKPLIQRCLGNLGNLRKRSLNRCTSSAPVLGRGGGGGVRFEKLDGVSGGGSAHRLSYRTRADSHQLTHVPCTSHLNMIPYTVAKKASTANSRASCSWHSTLQEHYIHVVLDSTKQCPENVDGAPCVCCACTQVLLCLHGLL